MPRGQRIQSEADTYHVIVRGEGRRIIFEDDEDRDTFLRMLEASAQRYGVALYAWCLMSNHAHIIARVCLERLSRMMQSLTSGYAVYYNKRHGHVGHVFAGRYKSEPIDGDEYLMAAVRYIHFNPIKGGLSKTCDYAWSSYRDYLENTGFTDTSLVLEIFGGERAFIAAHETENANLAGYHGRAQKGVRHRVDDTEAREIAVEIFGEEGIQNLANEERERRNRGIATLRRAGLTTNQVERITGIGRGIIDRVKWKS